MPEWSFVLEDLREVCNQYCLDFWAVVGNWVAGLATVAAVIVSLYLARQDQRVRLRVSAVVGQIIGDPNVDHHTDHIWIQVRSIGRRSATLNGIGWRIGAFPHWVPKIGRKHALQFTNLPNCTPTPVRLEDGGTASFMIPLDNWLEQSAPKLLPRPFWLTQRFIFVEAYLSTGQTFRIRAARPLREKITDAARAAAKTPAG